MFLFQRESSRLELSGELGSWEQTGNNGRFISPIQTFHPEYPDVTASIVNDAPDFPEQALLLQGIPQFKNCLCTKRKENPKNPTLILPSHKTKQKSPHICFQKCFTFNSLYQMCYNSLEEMGRCIFAVGFFSSKPQSSHQKLRFSIFFHGENFLFTH